MPIPDPVEVRRHGLAAPALAGFIAGSAVQLQQAALWGGAVYGLMLLGSVLLLALAGRRNVSRHPAAALAALAFALLAFSLCGLRAGVFMSRALEPELQGRDISVTGVAAAMPQRGEEGVRFRLDVESARAGDAEVKLPPRIYLGWYSGFGNAPADAQTQPATLHAGERWQMTVRLKSPHGNSNPGGFDYELWLWEQDLQATGYVRAGAKDTAPRRVGVTWQHPIERARQAVRDAVFERVADRKLAGVIAALVTGDQGAIERADWDTFRATGVAHLMSISGLHVTMFAWLAAALVGWLWRRSDLVGRSWCLRVPAPSAGLVGGMLLAAAYAAFSGWGVPAQRTVWMLATVGLLRIAGLRWPWPHVWLLTCAVVVAADPWALMQSGFWLSFVAVGVLFASGPQDAQADGEGGWRTRAFAAMREQWVVTLALTPLTLLLFGQVSAVGLLANALAIPWVTLVVTPLAMLGAALPLLWDAAALCIQGLGVYLGWLASWPHASVSVPAAPLWAGAAGVAGGLLLVMRLPPVLRLMGLPLMLPVLLWQSPRPPEGQFELLAADVGQGNAVIVRTSAHTLVYDTGPRFGSESDAGNRVLVPLLRASGDAVDTVMLSHRDADHIGGAPAVLAMQPDARLLSSIEDGHALQQIRKSERCRAGQKWEWDGVRFEVLQPQAADYDAPGKSNGMSCVLRIAAAGRGGDGAVALLAGDIEEPQEQRLLAQGATLKADLLLVPHHGSKTSSSASFLDAVGPHTAIAQAGYRNRFNHPAPQVAARYGEHGIRLLDSPHCGAASWSSGAPQEVRCNRADARRYWHHVLPPDIP
ncbi:MAG: DNA internalization-related competence protein ComEC/Rec2 [Comamonadaceae bacterium]|nr:MAG: DNA internalization-related competence protein ComEC/Rec2 [Comamonadaceae bacterium]